MRRALSPAASAIRLLVGAHLLLLVTAGLLLHGATGLPAPLRLLVRIILAIGIVALSAALAGRSARHGPSRADRWRR
jgi:hypothetical protein